MATTTNTAAVPPPHVALLPCAGMGHLMPFLRLAAMLASRNCHVTLITALPTVSAAESDHLTDFFAANPHITPLEFQLPPHKKSEFTNEDPFFIQIESIANSVHLLRPLLSSLSPPLSAIVADFPVCHSVSQLASHISIPTYTVITTSARFFTLMAHLPQLNNSIEEKGNKNCIEVPGLGSMHASNIPPPMLSKNHFFAANISSNVSSLSKVKGVLINTFNWFEREAIDALSTNVGTHILPIGPLESFHTLQARNNLPWLDKQVDQSVLLVSFGSRTALSKDQIRELAAGLELSGCKFLWVLKGSKVDKDDKEEAEDILGESFLARIKKQGMVIKGWVNQEEILGHRAIGGFVSHCGWNSVIEAARLGVPVFGWPLHGDQRVNAEAVENSRLGSWVRDWGWGGERLIGRDEIAEKTMELMGDEKLRDRVKEVKERAREARGVGGSSERLLQGLIESLKSKEKA